ncbi:DNA topology modulation protein [Paenibacillus campi]|uniref:DNA topology modulation protein n=1 Tax=Paenibacillus campi TaxID=3106031 RepID=UPI002AFEB963|nr:DNA topology modulation protein [Paenibacillus sp. SGZ-1014]
MKRIVILGCSGSGKSTLSMQLQPLLNVPLIHLDRYYWKPNWQATEDEEWDRLVTEFAAAAEWIIDGNYFRTLDLRLKRAELIVWLDMPRRVCLYRVMKRWIRYYGRTRPDLNEECPEKIDWAFLRWVWNYPTRTRPRTIAKLQQLAPHQQVVIIQNRKQLHAFIARLHTLTTNAY